MPPQTETAFTYVGNELDLFEFATHWKTYWRSLIHQHLRGDVLEVGSGIGSNTTYLRNETQKSWLCLEPDASLVERAKRAVAQHPFPVKHQVGTLESLRDEQRFDCILYMDVLEHIQDDNAELKKASSRLRPGGKIIILSPAHQWLYSEFDHAVGHVRRYNKKAMHAAIPEDLKTESLIYLDSIGLAASMGNRFILRKSIPSKANILTWDRFFVPLSRVLDPLVGYTLGKSILCILSKSFS